MNDLLLACSEAIDAEIQHFGGGDKIEVLRQLLEAEKRARCPNPIEWVGVFDLPPTLNEQLRGGAYARHAKKKVWTRLARLQAEQQGCPQFTEKVWMRCTFRIGKDKDEEGLISSLKSLQDGLTPERDKAKRIIRGTGFIVDDAPRWLKLEEAIVEKAEEGAPESIVVRIRNWG